jgi:hypothetical protein
MEDDEDIFMAILQPLIISSVNESLKKQRLDPQTSSEDDEDIEDEVMHDIVPRNRFCT